LERAFPEGPTLELEIPDLGNFLFFYGYPQEVFDSFY